MQKTTFLGEKVSRKFYHSTLVIIQLTFHTNILNFHKLCIALENLYKGVFCLYLNLFSLGYSILLFTSVCFLCIVLHQTTTKLTKFLL